MRLRASYCAVLRLEGYAIERNQQRVSTEEHRVQMDQQLQEGLSRSWQIRAGAERWVRSTDTITQKRRAELPELLWADVSEESFQPHSLLYKKTTQKWSFLQPDLSWALWLMFCHSLISLMELKFVCKTIKVSVFSLIRRTESQQLGFGCCVPVGKDGRWRQVTCSGRWLVWTRPEGRGWSEILSASTEKTQTNFNYSWSDENK